MSAQFLTHRNDFMFRVVSNGWFISIEESLLTSAAASFDTNNASYRRVRNVMRMSHSEVRRFLIGYTLYVQGFAASKDAAYFCSFLV